MFSWWEKGNEGGGVDETWSRTIKNESTPCLMYFVYVTSHFAYPVNRLLLQFIFSKFSAGR